MTGGFAFRGVAKKRRLGPIRSDDRSDEEEPNAPAQPKDDQDGDTLDAFMMGIEKQVAQPGRSREFPDPSDVDEDGDPSVGYSLEEMDSCEAGESPTEKVAPQDSGYEVETLDPIDYSALSLPPFRKDFYEPHATVSALTQEDVEQRRKLGAISVHSWDSAAIPGPVQSFGFDCPTEIQAQALPLALSGRDIIGLAKTGSGKTLAFLIPLLVHVVDQPRVRQEEGPVALVCSPTRELASQIASEARRLGKPFGLKVALVVGGESKYVQFKELRDGGADVVVCTPGRLIDMLRMRACSMGRVTYVVVDEADRLLDMGFEPQIKSILGQIRPDRQLLLFSATFNKPIEELAERLLNPNAVKIVVGEVGIVNENVTQHFEIFPDSKEKLSWLLREIPDLLARGAVVIFSTTKGSCAELTNQLRLAGHPTLSIHGETDQQDREGMTRMFKSGEIPLMVATDIFARGLDIKIIRSVVSYDPPRSIDWYTHRVGRTARGGADGNAYCLLTDKDKWFARELCRSQGKAGLPIPDHLRMLARSLKSHPSRTDATRGRRSVPSLPRQERRQRHDMGKEALDPVP